MTRITILGAGTAGTIMANRLEKLCRADIKAGNTTITIVDQDDRHLYQPGLLYIPFDLYRPDQIQKPRRPFLPKGVDYVQQPIDHVAVAEDKVYLADGSSIGHDVLIIATGTQLATDETEGLTGAGWRERIFDYYTMEGATALRGAMEQFKGGRLVINIVDMPIKCPVAPLEFAFLADWYFTRRGLRDDVQIRFVTPLDGAFTRPLASRTFGSMLEDRGIELVAEFSTGSVDGAAGKLISWDERVVDFDLLVTIPAHSGADYIGASPGLGDELNFVPTDPATLQARAKANIFALGDATDLPTSKAGSVAHFQSELLTDNIRRYLAGEPLEADFDGHANCFIETGFRKGMLIDFNYDVEPLPGKFPFRGIGPMHLLKENRMNHLGKLAFRWVYWNMLLPGRPLPGISARMRTRGKKMPDALPNQPGRTAGGY